MKVTICGILKSGKQTDARSISSTGEPVAWDSNRMQDSKVGTGEPVGWDSVIDVDLETSREYNLLSAESVSFKERVNTRLRIMLNRLPGDKMDDIDKHCLIWEISVFNNERCRFSWERLLRQFALHQKYR